MTGRSISAFGILAVTLVFALLGSANLDARGVAPSNAKGVAPSNAKGVAPSNAKGVAPSNANCDAHAKASALWRDCIGALSARHSNDELFYAGYWLAKNGRYDEALSFLNRATVKDERVLTYIGFATRKSGDVEAAMGFYNRALAVNPDYTIARSYLGEAHLTRGEPDKARVELDEIASRCGTSCAEYTQLRDAISQYNAARS